MNGPDPKYRETVPDYADLFTFAEFSEMIDSGYVSNDDGTGYYATPTEMTRVPVDCRFFPSIPWLDAIPADLTHVAWFNK